MSNRDELLSEISKEMNEIMTKLSELDKEKRKLRDRQSELIASWQMKGQNK